MESKKIRFACKNISTLSEPDLVTVWVMETRCADNCLFQYSVRFSA